MGLWKPTPKDIFKSRWKRFYKRTYRMRNRSNRPDRAGPHAAPKSNPDGVPSPWRLLMSNEYFGDQLPPDVRGKRITHYSSNENLLLRPMMNCKSPAALHTMLRCLDPGRRGGADSGLGRNETARCEPGQKLEHVPEHLFNVLKGQSDKNEGSGDFFMAMTAEWSDKDASLRFPVRRVQELVEEWELVWEAGQNNPNAERRPPKGDELNEVDRGRFPYIDEQAGLLDDLKLDDILKLSHRTKNRRHPKWREIAYEYKKSHIQYLRRRQMNLDEAKARMGVMRQALADV